VVENVKVMIRGGTLLKGPALEPVRGEAIVVDGERIVSIAPERSITVGPDWRVVDADGHTVIPGLIDAHAFFGSRSRTDDVGDRAADAQLRPRGIRRPQSCSTTASPRCATSARQNGVASAAPSTSARSWGPAPCRRTWACR
jgi:imidazolonepropionase-like amidohydrolase